MSKKFHDEAINIISNLVLEVSPSGAPSSKTKTIKKQKKQGKQKNKSNHGQGTKQTSKEKVNKNTQGKKPKQDGQGTKQTSKDKVNKNTQGKNLKQDNKPHPSGLSLDQRVKLALSVGEECIKPEEMRNLLDKHPRPIAYDGFEPSGRMHIAQGILKSINVNKLTKVGVHFVFWVADWFAMLNNKMGGDLEKIQTVGKYMVEIWKAAGMDLKNVEFRWAQEEINKHADQYWQLVMDIAKKFNLARIARCSTIMGREEGDNMPAAQILYPCMQCADIFFLKANICQLGMDQRKVNMLAREYLDFKDVKKKYGKNKPIILSHHMLLGLAKGQVKMSKSSPNSAIFMEDSAEDVIRKIQLAYCPPKIVALNPCLDYAEHIVFNKFGSMTIERKQGKHVYNSYESMAADYSTGIIVPADLKSALARDINRILQPVRDHFQKPGPKALLEKVRSFKVTR